MGTRCNQYGCGLYNTLCSITPNDTGIDIQRVIPQLFIDGEEPQYGTFATTYHSSEDAMYMLSSDGRIAKAPWSTLDDKSTYTYWTGGSNYGSVSTDGAQLVDADNNNLSGSMCGWATGDIFFSAPNNNWVVIYMTSCVDSTFYMRYSLTGNIEGPYSDDMKVLATTPGAGGYSYAGHAYQHFMGDGSGSEVLLSWTIQAGDALGGYQMGIASMTFA